MRTTAVTPTRRARRGTAPVAYGSVRQLAGFELDDAPVCQPTGRILSDGVALPGRLKIVRSTQAASFEATFRPCSRGYAHGFVVLRAGLLASAFDDCDALVIGASLRITAGVGDNHTNVCDGPGQRSPGFSTAWRVYPTQSVPCLHALCVCLRVTFSRGLIHHNTELGNNYAQLFKAARRRQKTL